MTRLNNAGEVDISLMQPGVDDEFFVVFDSTHRFVGVAMKDDALKNISEFNDETCKARITTNRLSRILRSREYYYNINGFRKE